MHTTYFIYYISVLLYVNKAQKLQRNINRTHLRGKGEREESTAAGTGRASVSNPDRCYTGFPHSISSECQTWSPGYLIKSSHILYHLHILSYSRQ